MKVITSELLSKFYNKLTTIFAKKDEVNVTVLNGRLNAGETILSLESEKITEDSIIDVYTDTYGLTPSSITQLNNSITLTFKPQSSDVNIKVVIR